MSEQLPSVNRGLLNSDDPELWAEEFCRIFAGKIIGDDIEEGSMVTWFGNAMQVAIDLRERKQRIEEQHTPLGAVTEEVRESFVEGAEEGRGESTERTDAADPKA